MTAQNWKVADIADALGVTTARVNTYLRNPEVQALVVTHRRELGLDHAYELGKIVPKAIRALDGVLEDPDASASARISAAGEVLDRTLGKPQQKVEVENRSIKEVFQAIDQLGLKLVEKHSPKQLESKEKLVVEVEAQEVESTPVEATTPSQSPPNSSKPESTFDANGWVKDNLSKLPGRK